MKTSRRLMLAVTAFAATLFATIGVASAGRLSVNDQDVYFKWTDGTQRLNYSGGGIRIECEVTFLGTFNTRTFTKTARGVIGAITHTDVDTAGCTNGTWSFPRADLPWEITFSSFSGTLPTITRVRLALIDYTFLIFNATFPTARCIGRSDVAEPVVEDLALTSGTITSITPDSGVVIAIDDLGESMYCDLAGGLAFTGTASVEDGEGASVTITLI